MKETIINKLFNIIRETDNMNYDSEILDEQIGKFWTYEDLLKNNLLNEEQKIILELQNVNSNFQLPTYDELQGFTFYSTAHSNYSG